MLENMTTGEKALIGATAIGIAALVFHKPTRNAVGLSDGKRKAIVSSKMRTQDGMIVGKVQYNNYWDKYQVVIDGVTYGEYDEPKEAIEELKGAGFKIKRNK
jgi:hypothetical protein